MLNIKKKNKTSPDIAQVQDVLPAEEKATDKEADGTQPSKKGTKGGRKNAPRTTMQRTIPYERVYENGVIEADDGTFSKMYPIQDINFRIASQQEQESIYIKYCDIINSVNQNCTMQLFINNTNIDQEKFNESILLKPQADTVNDLREEFNDMLLEKLNEGKNNIKRDKYFVVSVPAEDIDEANNIFSRIDIELSTGLKRICGAEAYPVSIKERMNILHNIFNLDKESDFDRKISVNGQTTHSFDLKNLKRMGITSKDVIGPEYFEFNVKTPDYFKIGDKYARVLFLENVPAFMNTDFLDEIINISCNMCTSVYYKPIPQDAALKMMKRQLVNINSNIVDAQKRASRGGYSIDLISPDLKKAKEEAEKIIEDMTSRNQKMFLISMLVMHMADSLEELNKYTDIIASTASGKICTIKKLSHQQEIGFQSALPLGMNKVKVNRAMTTESAAVFLPYSAQEMFQNRGMFYGLHAVSKNMIFYNRLLGLNPSGLILGKPGAGKSFTAKREMANVFLNTDDEIFIIDPDREYTHLAEAFGGQVVKIAAGSKTYINPMDMDLDYAGEDSPIALKADNIASLCETIIGGKFGLSPIEKSIIDRCVSRVYEKYEEALAQKSVEIGERITYDRELMPTLKDFYKTLKEQREPEANYLAVALERYAVGSMDIFSHTSNIDVNNRFTVYDIKDLGSNMKEMGVHICLNDIWNKIISNAKKGKRTWFYIDEFYLLTKTETSAKFLQEIFKRIRKWSGIITGITQNVQDMLESNEARTIISNCEFVIMLNQSAIDRQELSAMFGISSAQQQYITDSDAGCGLMYTGNSLIPFIDKFPKDTKLYKIMSTKPDERLIG